MAPNFDFQLNNMDQHKTLNEMVEEAFSVKKQVIDLSFFYDDKPKKNDAPQVHQK